MGKLTVDLPNEPFFLRFVQPFQDIKENEIMIVTKYYVEIGSLSVKLKFLDIEDFITYEPDFMVFLNKETNNPN